MFRVRNRTRHYAFVICWHLMNGLAASWMCRADNLPPNADPALAAVLNYDGDGEGVHIEGAMQHQLDLTLPGEELVLVWKVIGPTYWSSLISVVSWQGGQWKLLARRNLEGAELVLESISPEGVILLSAKVPGSNDPICCPSQAKVFKFSYSPGKLLDANMNGAP